MNELVEHSIAAELKETAHGAIMHDALIRASVHYVAVFSCYIRKIRIRADGAREKVVPKFR